MGKFFTVGNMSEEAKKWLDDLLLRDITDIYANYRREREYRPKYPEPMLTVAYLRDWVEQYRMPADFEYATRKTRDAMVLASLKRLEGRNLLTTSIGIGVNGAEARCWEPVKRTANPASTVMADERDLLDAIQHADLYGDQGWTLDDFKIVSLGEVPLGRIREYEDWGAWIDVDPEDYVGLSVEERLAKLAEFRGPRWAERAAGWLKNGVPPIVVIDAPIVDEHSVHRQIGDGRGRINFALAMGLKRLPVVLMKWKHPLQPAKRTNPADWLWSKTKARCLKRGDVMQLMVHGEEEPSAWVVKTARHGSWARERMVQVALKRFGDPGAKIQEFNDRWYLNDEVIVSYRLGLDCDENPEARRASR